MNMRLKVDYCFKNEHATCGFTSGSIDYPRNPRKETASEVMRLLEAASEKEKKPVILVGFYEYGI